MNAREEAPLAANHHVAFHGIATHCAGRQHLLCNATAFARSTTFPRGNQVLGPQEASFTCFISPDRISAPQTELRRAPNPVEWSDIEFSCDTKIEIWHGRKHDKCTWRCQGSFQADIPYKYTIWRLVPMLLLQKIPPRPVSALCSPRSLHFRSWFVFVPIGNMRHEPIPSTSLKHRPVSALERCIENLIPRGILRARYKRRRVALPSFIPPSPSPLFPLDSSFWPIHRRLLAPNTQHNHRLPTPTPTRLRPSPRPPPLVYSDRSLRRHYARSSRDPPPVPPACIAKFPLAAHLVPLTDSLGTRYSIAAVTSALLPVAEPRSPRTLVPTPPLGRCPFPPFRAPPATAGYTPARCTGRASSASSARQCEDDADADDPTLVLASAAAR
ncbi:hypothetical protein FB451DRAFT_1261163, partial [Mycena latifolia]